MVRHFRRPSLRLASLAAATRRSARVLASLPAFVALAGCASNLSGIDRRVDELIAEANESVHVNVPGPSLDPGRPARIAPHDTDPRATDLPTVNPPASALSFSPKEDTRSVLERLQAGDPPLENPVPMGLAEALAYAVAYSREYRFAEETYLLVCLQLLIEDHRFGPRFFNDTTVAFNADGDDGTFDTALELVNDFRVTKQLLYGGEIAAQALVVASEDLHTRVSDASAQSADIILSADIPLLRGAGPVASEALIQAKREVIYTARGFERFRREFLFSIATDFFDLIVQQQSIRNQEEQVQSLEELMERERMRFDAGRIPFYEVGLAEDRTVVAADTLTGQRERYRLDVDRFKSRLGMPIDVPLVILPTEFDLRPPDISPDEAMILGFAYRLDLQTFRDRVGDSRRAVANARNALLPDLNVFGSVSLLSDDDDLVRDTIGFDPTDADFRVGATLGLPLDRTIEKVNVRQAEIDLDRTRRAYEQLRDDVAIATRSSVRAINRAQFSLDIQRQSVLVAEERKRSVEAAPERVDARNASDAVLDLNRARDAVDSAARDLQVAILQYLLDTGQLRVGDDGFIQPLPGMEVSGERDDEPPTDPLPRPAPAAGGGPAAIR